jgi:hypothetical protein
MSRWSPEFNALLKKRGQHLREAGNEAITLSWRLHRMNFHLARECGRTRSMLERAMAEPNIEEVKYVG